MNICDTLLPNGMACHHHMEDQVIINHKGQHLDGYISNLKEFFFFQITNTTIQIDGCIPKQLIKWMGRL
jgi:hypothetical protein